MRLISTKVLQPGMVIGRTIWNEAGRPLLHEGVVASSQIINRLSQLNVQYVYINDKISQGIEIVEAVPLHARRQAVEKITGSFTMLKDRKNVDSTYCLDQQSKHFVSIIDQLLESIVNSEEIITVLSDAFIYDEYIYQHSLQVAIYSIAIARELKYTSDEVRQIGIGAMLHDVGKMLIPQEILSKPSRLTNEEYNTMKFHAKYGFDLLRNLHTISLLSAHCAFQHHERLDGSGYPRGLIDFEIHPYAKIIAVADVFDAVTSNRVYRKKMLPSQGMEIINQGIGTLYDEKVVKAFQKCIAVYPNGTVVLLSDGRRAIVSKQNRMAPERPWIRIFEENGELLSATYESCLEDEPAVKIQQVEVEYLIHSE
ncbi:HD-GYP domain-containing protein [Viridibacillus sp. YIM B01967]|uniref:HD-GYP domain-containing protein n=1 Tax=Viridibacillus soli TaxID=2798301 RepID=A0ABS1HB04_9BACL|nr:HD-GYP domain-containing protein [Viridibacillus soli]MBK3496158.1 HD-GYP domain-containing protein [Viridibacillus soli]